MSKPTVVLVHGAFGDASSWRRVFDLLDGEDFTVLAPANPLRGLAGDAAYISAVIDQLVGPVVLAVFYDLVVSWMAETRPNPAKEVPSATPAIS